MSHHLSGWRTSDPITIGCPIFATVLSWLRWGIFAAAAGCSNPGVKLLDLEDLDKVAAAVVIPLKKPKPNPKRERFCNR
jgi:hypothetical protein